MVIQASAGQRLTATEPSLAADAYGDIGEAARQAEAEIARLVEPIGELVARAGAAGLAVSCRFSGSTARVPAQGADTAYRIVQEGLTNTFKHALRAPVEVVVARSTSN